MAQYIYITTIVILAILPKYHLGQIPAKTNECYTDKFPDITKVFTKMLYTPSLRGGHDALVNYLMTNIDFQWLVGDLEQNETNYYDTARVKFIISKKGILSNLTVTRAKKKIFEEEVYKIIKKSSCNWVPGGTEMYLNGWFQFDISYSIERRLNEMTTKIKIKEFEYATD